MLERGRRRSPRRTALAGAAGVALLALAGCTGGGDPPPGPPPPPPLAPYLPGGVSSSAGAERDVAVGADGRREATLDVVSGATTVLVEGGGADLVRASTPAGSRVAPVLDAAGDTVRVRLVDAAGDGPAALTVRLGERVRWRVRLSGGAEQATFLLGGVRLAGLDLAAGISRIDATLPRPEGVVPVLMSGGARDLLLHLPAGTAAGLRVGGGAGSVEVDGVRRTGLAGGTTITTASAADRYEVDAVAGVSSVVLDRQ